MPPDRTEKHPHSPFPDFASAARAVFGQYCGGDEAPTPELMGRLLSTILASEMRVAAESRRADRAEADAVVDPSTGLVNAQGWLAALAAEEDRCRRHAHAASVIVVRFDDPEPEDLPQAARCLFAETRAHDVVARPGPREFVILATSCPWTEAEVLAARVSDTLSANGLPATVGAATRHPDHGLAEAWEQARERACSDRLAEPAGRLTQLPASGAHATSPSSVGAARSG